MVYTQAQIKAIDEAIYFLQDAEATLIKAGFSVDAQLNLHVGQNYAGAIVSYDEGIFNLDVFDAHERP